MYSRRFLLASVAAVVAAPLVANAQERAVPRIVVLSLSAPADQTQAFEQGLRTLGYQPGATISIDYLSVEERAERLPALASQAAGGHPQAIVAIGSTAAIAARQATKELPIIAVIGDIVASGLATNLGRPEGNVTGLSFFAAELMLKRLDLLLELAPNIRRLMVVVQSPPHPTQLRGVAALRTAGKKRGIEVHEVPLARAEDVKAMFAKVREPTGHAFLFWSSPVFDTQAGEIGRLAAEFRLIGIFPWKEYAFGGGLVAYAPDILALWRRAAAYVDRIVRGAKPADLPIEQPTKFELVVNMKTAKALGLTIPPSLLLRADHVIE